MAYDTAVCFRRKRKVSISDDGDRSSLSRTRTSRVRMAAGREGKGVGLRGSLTRRVRKIAISDRLTPREISPFLVRGGKREAVLSANGNGEDLVLRIVNDHCPRIHSFLPCPVFVD